MNVLLIRHHPRPAGPSGRYAVPGSALIPLGLAYLAASLERQGFRVDVLDSLVRVRTLAEFERALQGRDVDVVGVTAMTDAVRGALEAADIVRSVLPNATSVLGGAHMATYPAETLARGAFDFGVVGEGEQTFPELVKAIRDGKNMEAIPGVLSKESLDTRNLHLKPRLDDLDRLPHPDRSLFPNRAYRTALGRNPVTYLISSRGCPFTCTFCDHGFWGRKVTYHSPEWVVEEMERCRAAGAREFYIYDETFNLKPERVFRICDLIRKRRLDLSWVVSARVDTIDREMIRSLKAAGCRQMRFGVETGVERHLRNLKKGVTLEQIRRAFRTCQAVGMETYAYFMLGLPGETVEEMEASVRWALELDPDWVNFNILMMKPGTEIYREAVARGTHPPDFWKACLDDRACESDCYLLPPDMSAADMNRFIQKAYRRFYFRTEFIRRRLKEITQPGRFRAYAEGFARGYVNRFFGHYANVRF